MATDLTAALDQHFGFTAFRGMQEEVIRHVMSGHHALVIMPTGEGKSLCYQLPALLGEGVALVVSPLIALMEDQVLALRGKGIAASCIHSLLSADERRDRLELALGGQLKILYITPERFRVGNFQERIRAIPISLLAVDEAHCVSQWGHDFRPDYSKLGIIRKTLGSPTTLALTATATPAVQEDILSVLQIPDAQTYHTGIERPNLFLSVNEVDNEEQKVERILEVIEDIGGPGIIYHALIRDLRRTEDHLLRCGFKPLVYHGDLSASERKEQQSKFLASRDDLILATNAFGMGVDKADIRFILHYQVPRTLEAYYQEIGRAGRDGENAFCELLYHEPDVSIQREFTEWANPNQQFMQQLVDHIEGLGERLHAVDLQTLRETFLLKNRRDGRIETCLRLLRSAGCATGNLGLDFEWLRSPTTAEIAQWLPEDKRERNLRGLLEMVRYARANGCRKNVIHDYFGFPSIEEGCGSCDLDESPSEWMNQGSRRRPIPRGSNVSDEHHDEAEINRGDWIQIRGWGLCSIARVHREKKRVRVDVELARDLSMRSFDLARVKWRKVT